MSFFWLAIDRSVHEDERLPTHQNMRGFGIGVVDDGNELADHLDDCRTHEEPNFKQMFGRS